MLIHVLYREALAVVYQKGVRTADRTEVRVERTSTPQVYAVGEDH